MVKTKSFDCSKQIIKYGFIELEPSKSQIELADVISSAKENIVVVDTNGAFLLNSLTEFSSYLNQQEKLFIGLVNKSTLNSLHDSGVKTGFIRATDVNFEIGLIIVDKKYVYSVFDKTHIYSIINEKASKEIFDLVNHVIWSKTNFEFFQGELKKVNEIRQSVVLPSFEQSVRKPSSSKIASRDADINSNVVLLEKEENINQEALVALRKINAFSGEFPMVSVNVFEDKYYSFSIEEKSFIRAISFSNKPLLELANKNIWVDGKVYDVQESDIIEFDVSVPLDEVESYTPDYESKAKAYANYSLMLKVVANVSPIKLDGSYALLNRYGIIDRVKKDIEEGLARLEKMDPEKDVLKKIKAVREERNLPTRVKMFNKLASENVFGDESLKNKKSPIVVINVNENDLFVPNELIGKLYTKKGNTFFATTMERINDAKKWLNENKMEAVLIEA